MPDTNEAVRAAAERHRTAMRLIREAKSILSNEILDNSSLSEAPKSERDVSFQRAELYRKLEAGTRILAEARDKFR